MEMPLMLVVTMLAARWVVRRLAVPPTLSQRLAVGLIALSLLLIAASAVVLGLQELTMEAYLASRDPLAGTVYLVMLGGFALMPLSVDRR